MRVLTDSDIESLPLAPLLDAVRAHLIADARGDTVAPARHVVPFDEGGLVFTIGGNRRLAGFRAYQTFAKPGHPADDQVIAAWDQSSGEMLGLALGNRLGALRTGVIGGVAADCLAPRDARVLAVLGTGRQAETQLVAIAGVRDFHELRVYGRTSAALDAFVRRLSALLGKPVTAYSDAREALAGADVVVLATTAEAPVIEARWVEPYAYVATIGPKSLDAHELPLELAARARLIVTDSPQQVESMGESHMLSGHEAGGRIRHLGDVASGDEPVVAPALFLSMGLAGSEVVCLEAALQSAPG